MKITKLGHCCLLIEEVSSLGNTVRILTDPGNLSEGQNELVGIDVLLITHEHQDHFHIDSVKKILEKNKPVIITNASVDALLQKEGIVGAFIVPHGEHTEINGILFRGFGSKHAVIYPELPIAENTGYMIGERLYYPGDAFYNPKDFDTTQQIDVLALPVSGPWMKISEAIDFAVLVAPKIAFPVHDGILNESGNGIVQRVSTMLLQKHNIECIQLEIGKQTLL